MKTPRILLLDPINSNQTKDRMEFQSISPLSPYEGVENVVLEDIVVDSSDSKNDYLSPTSLDYSDSDIFEDSIRVLVEPATIQPTIKEVICQKEEEIVNKVAELDISAVLSDDAMEEAVMHKTTVDNSIFYADRTNKIPEIISIPFNPEPRVSPHYMSCESEAFEIAEFTRIPSFARSIYIAADSHGNSLTRSSISRVRDISLQNENSCIPSIIDDEESETVHELLSTVTSLPGADVRIS